MNFEESLQTTGFTVYSKSGCVNCVKAKEILKGKNLLFVTVDCDEYLIEDRENFLFFISQKANKECKSFPMIFNDGVFIGGVSELKIHIDKLFSFIENITF